MPYLENIFKFLKIDKLNGFQGAVYSQTHNTTYDGITFNEETEEIYFGAFFFMSNMRGEHSYRLYSILTFLSEIGGILAACDLVFGTLGKYINTQLYISKILSNLQYFKFSEHELQNKQIMARSTMHHSGLYSIRFNVSEIFSGLVQMFCIAFCCKCMKKKRTYLTATQHLYLNGLKSMERDLSNYDVLKTIKKLKAAVSHLVDSK